MHANMTSPAKENDVGDIAFDLYPFLRQYKGGRIERLVSSPFVPASEDNRGVATRDVVIHKSTGVSARLFLPSRAAATGERLPVITYIHGGSFCTESAFCRTYHNYASSLAARTGALVVSVEYRLAPEHPMPAAYDDAWAALQWVASLSDPWLADHADLERMFLAGDSAGGNIVYHTALRASNLRLDIEGLVMVHPYFWGSERLPSEVVWDGAAMFRPESVDRLWPFVTAGQASNDDPRINLPGEEISSLTCRRVLLAVAEKDILRDRGCLLAARMRDCAWAGDNVALVESEGEDHCFHLYNPLRATSKKLMDRIVEFVNHRMAMPLPAALLPELHECESKTLAIAGEMESAKPFMGVPTRPYIGTNSTTRSRL
jgi:acetyl esterase/lipase